MKCQDFTYRIAESIFIDNKLVSADSDRRPARLARRYAAPVVDEMLVASPWWLVLACDARAVRLCDRISVSMRIAALSRRHCIFEEFGGTKLLGAHSRQQLFSGRHNGAHSLLNHLVDVWDVGFVLAGPFGNSLTADVSIAELPVRLVL